MRRTALLSLAAAALSTAPGFAQSSQRSFRAPSLGYVWDAAQNQVRPIIGMAGASYLGSAASLGITPARALFPPQHDFALLLDSDTQTWSIYRPETGALESKAAASLSALAKTIVFSPNGRTLAALDGDGLRILSKLPASAATRVLSLPAGLSLLAVSDSGAAILADSDGAAFLATDSLQPIGADGAIAAAAFRSGSNDAALADRSGNRILLMNGSGEVSVAAAAGDGIDTPQSLDFTDDGQRVVLLQGQPARVSLLALDGSGLTGVPCECTVSSLARLQGRSIYQLQPAGSGPMWILDANKANVRTLFVAAGPAVSQTQAAATQGGIAQ